MEQRVGQQQSQGVKTRWAAIKTLRWMYDVTGMDRVKNEKNKRNCKSNRSVQQNPADKTTVVRYAD